MNKIIVVLILLCSISLNAQSSIKDEKTIDITFKTIEKYTKDEIIYSSSEILSNGKIIGAVRSDLDGFTWFSIDQKEIIDNKITLKIVAIKCKPFEKEYVIDRDTHLIIDLEYGETEIMTMSDFQEYTKRTSNWCGLQN